MALVGFVVGEEPARGFGEEPDEEHDEEGGHGLDDDGDAPGPVCRELAGSVAGPCCG